MPATRPRVAARKIALTDRALKALKPAPKGKRIVVWDAMMPNLAIRFGTKRRPAFYLVRRRAGEAQPTWLKLGDYPIISLKDARRAAAEALDALMTGKDPTVIGPMGRRATSGRQLERATKSFGAVTERFIEWYRATPGRDGKPRRRADDVVAVIRRELIPCWDGRPIGEISEDDVIRVVETIRMRGGAAAAPGSKRVSGGPYAARHAFAAARLIFDWARRPAAGRLIPANPCTGVDAKRDLNLAPAARDRVLDDSELEPVWRAAEATPYPYGPLVRLLLLTGARLREIAEASWDEIDLEGALLTVPTSRMKMKAAHVIPLNAAALAIVRELPRFTDGGYIFTTTRGRRPISGFSKFRAKFNETLKTYGWRAAAPFTLHDLRRTVRTGLSSLEVPEEYAERVIGHQPQGIKATYDLHRYDKQKREALAKWEAKLRAKGAATATAVLAGART